MSDAVEQLDPFSTLQDIAERSRRNAFGIPEQSENTAYWHGIAFRIGSHALVMSLSDVREILRLPTMSAVPGAKAWVKGIANVRGTLLPILDLKGFLGQGRTITDRQTRVLVVHSEGASAGLLVSEVLGLKHFPEEARSEDVPGVGGPLEEYLAGSYRDGIEQWGLFNLKQLMQSPDFMQVAAAEAL